VTHDPLTGYVVVLAAPAGAADADVDVRSLAVPTAVELMRCGVRLAVVSMDGVACHDIDRNAALQSVDPPIAWRADPADPSTWERLAPHIEQRVGPVDAVVVDPAALDAVQAAFAGDMSRRGHGAIVVLIPAENPLEVLRRELHRRR
jgi:hypothetical protein